MMEIILAKLDDLESITSLNSQFHLEIDNFKWDTPKWISQEIKQGHYVLLKEKNDTLGAMCLEPKEDIMYIQTIAVQQKLHKKGLGRNLINYAKIHAKKERSKKIVVESFLDYNLEGFYTKCGFLKSYFTQEYGGKKYNHYFMYV